MKQNAHNPTITATYALRALCIFVFFWTGAGGGLGAFFTTDDLVNMNHYVDHGIERIVKTNILFFGPEYRPFGGLFYVPLYSLFGLDPLPFRVACFTLLLINLGLAWRTAYLLTDSHEVAALSTLVGAFHPRLVDLYWSTGTIYDIACYLFFFAALCFYVQVRKHGRAPRAGTAAVILILSIAALNAKEMAVALAPVMVLYELLCRRSRIRDLVTSAKVPLIAGALTIPYLWNKLTQSASPLTQFERYSPTFSETQFLETYGSYLGQLFYVNEFSAQVTAFILLGSLSLCAALRDRNLLLSWSIAVVTALPIAFIPPRSPFAFYIPLTGWTIYFSSLIVRLRHSIHPRSNHPAYAMAMFIAVLILLLRAHRVQRERMAGSEVLAQQRIRRVVSDLNQHGVSFPEGARVLVVRDPFEGEGYTLVLLLRLYSRDRSLEVDHAATDDCSHPVALEWVGGALKSVRQTPCIQTL